MDFFYKRGSSLYRLWNDTKGGIGHLSVILTGYFNSQLFKTQKYMHTCTHIYNIYINKHIYAYMYVYMYINTSQKYEGEEVNIG